MGGGGQIFVFWFRRTQEDVSQDAFLRFSMVYLKMCR